MSSCFFLVVFPFPQCFGFFLFETLKVSSCFSVLRDTLHRTAVYIWKYYIIIQQKNISTASKLQKSFEVWGVMLNGCLNTLSCGCPAFPAKLLLLVISSWASRGSSVSENWESFHLLGLEVVWDTSRGWRSVRFFVWSVVFLCLVVFPLSNVPRAVANYFTAGDCLYIAAWVWVCIR